MTRVVVFEDNALISEGLSLMIQNEPDMLLAGAFRDATQVLTKIKRCKPDVVLMDIHMPEVSGIEAVAEIKYAFPEILVMMQTVFEEEDKVFAAICKGASAYILKGTPPQQMLLAIREMLAGGSPMSPIIARKVMHLFQQNFNHSTVEYVLLTAKEKEVLNFLVEGLSYKMIADRMGITFHTVNDYLKKIYHKLHVNSAPEAVSKALRHKML